PAFRGPHGRPSARPHAVPPATGSLRPTGRRCFGTLGTCRPAGALNCIVFLRIHPPTHTTGMGTRAQAQQVRIDDTRMVSLLKKLIGSRNDRILKQYRKQVAQINALESGMASLSDEQLAAKADEFRSRHGE